MSDLLDMLNPNSSDAILDRFREKHAVAINRLLRAAPRREYIPRYFEEMSDMLSVAPHFLLATWYSQSHDIPISGPDWFQNWTRYALERATYFKGTNSPLLRNILVEGSKESIRHLIVDKRLAPSILPFFFTNFMTLLTDPRRYYRLGQASRLESEECAALFDEYALRYPLFTLPDVVGSGMTWVHSCPMLTSSPQFMDWISHTLMRHVSTYFLDDDELMDDPTELSQLNNLVDIMAYHPHAPVLAIQALKAPPHPSVLTHVLRQLNRPVSPQDLSRLLASSPPEIVSAILGQLNSLRPASVATGSITR